MNSPTRWANSAAAIQCTQIFDGCHNGHGESQANCPDLLCCTM